MYNQKAVDSECQEYSGGINPGLTHKCETCYESWRYVFCTMGETPPSLIEQAISDGTISDEGGLSWRPCETCGSTLGGNRFAAHGLTDKGDIIHYDICVDCLMYLANGDLPSEDN